MPKFILAVLLAVPVSFIHADEQRMPREGRCQRRMVNVRVDDAEAEQRRMLFESYEYNTDERAQTDWDGSYSSNDARDPEGF
jgi:hypothetical protein